VDRHILQTRANYCVPACIAMVEAWRGTLAVEPTVRQELLFAQLSQGMFCSLDAAASVVPNEGYGEPDIGDAEMFRALSNAIRSGRRVIVTCWPGELGRILRIRNLFSPHGSLPDGNLPHHAIYLFGASGEHFDAYDPWHTDDGQPLRLEWDELAVAWTRMMLIATK